MEPTANTKFVVLQGIEDGNIFWTGYQPKIDTPETIVKSVRGLTYKVISYHDTDAAALQAYLDARKRQQNSFK